MDDLDIIALFATDDGENERNNALRLILDDVMELLPEPDDLKVRERGERARNQNYYEIIVPQYDNILFKEHFRMSRATFEVYIIVYFMKVEFLIRVKSNIQHNFFETIVPISEREQFAVFGRKLHFRGASLQFCGQIFLGSGQCNWTCYSWKSKLPCEFKKKSYVLGLDFG